MLTVVTVPKMRRLPMRNVAENFLMSSTQAIRVSTMIAKKKYGQMLV